MLIPVLVLGGLEACARLLDIRPAGGPEAAVPAWLDRNILVKESRWIELLSGSPRDLTNYYRTYKWDRQLFYSLRPGLDLPLTDITAPPTLRERTRWVFHTNSRGFNAREVPYDKPAGTFRIVALGDSSTFGWGVDTEDVYPHLLEGILRRRHPGAAIEVVNLGVCGYSSQQGLTLLRREGLRFDPDLVTLSYGSNDYSMVPEPFDEAYARNMGWSGAARGVLNRSRAYQVYASYLLAGIGRGGGGAAGGGGHSDEGLVLNVGPEEGRENLVEMARLAVEKGIDPIFVTNCVPGEMASPIRAAASGTGVPLLDTAALLEGVIPAVLQGGPYREEASRYRALYGPATVERFPWLSVYLTDECHPNRIGHRVIAEALVPLVESSRSFQRFRSGPR